FVFVEDKAIDAEAEIGAEAALGGIEAIEEFALEQFGEETLREVLGVGGGAVPAKANVFVDGLPVGGAERVECAGAFGGVAAARGFDDGEAGEGEAAAGGSVRLSGHWLEMRMSLCRLNEG